MKTIYCNGRVYTGKLPLVQAFAVEGDKFLLAGSDEQVLAQIPLVAGESIQALTWMDLFIRLLGKVAMAG